MGKIGKIRPEQLRTAQKILRELPVKDTRCSSEEAAAFLEKDLKRAFRKGYTPKELCALLKKVGIIIPERLIARYHEPTEAYGKNRALQSGKQGGRDERNSILPNRQIGEGEVAKALTPTTEKRGRPMMKIESGLYGKSPLIQDTPRGVSQRISPFPFSGSSSASSEKATSPCVEKGTFCGLNSSISPIGTDLLYPARTKNPLQHSESPPSSRRSHLE